MFSRLKEKLWGEKKGEKKQPSPPQKKLPVCVLVLGLARAGKTAFVEVSHSSIPVHCHSPLISLSVLETGKRPPRREQVPIRHQLGPGDDEETAQHPHGYSG